MKKAISVFWVLTFIFLFSGQLQLAQAQLIKDGLAVYFSLDKAMVDGKKVKADFGKNEGVVMGDPEVVKGKIAEALSFNGKADYLVIGPATDGMDVSYSFWVKVAQLPGIPQVVLWDDNSRGGGDSWFQLQTDGKIHTERAGDGFGIMDSASAIKPNEWMQVTFVADSKNDKKIIYLNAKQDAESAGKINSRTGTSHVVLAVGHDSGNFIKPLYFEGAIDDVLIYNRVLSADEIKRIFAKTTPVEPAGKIGLVWGKLKSQLK